MPATIAMNFLCPKCSTPGEIPVPEGEIITGGSFNVAVWKNVFYTCPGCLSEFGTVLQHIKYEGQTWTLMEVKRKSSIIAPPGSNIPMVPPGIMGRG